MKTEPSTFAFDDLMRSPKKITSWEGVRNYQARNLMRDRFEIGDQVFIYHSRIDEPAVIGIANVVRKAYPDPTAFDSKSRYYDAKAKARGENPWCMVDVKATHRLETAVTREMMRSTPALAGIMVLRKGARLSVQPVTSSEFKAICQLGKAKAIK